MAENMKNIVEELREIASEADDALTTSDKEELCFALESARDWLYLAASELERAKRERDAAISDINMVCMCDICTRSCKYDKPNPYCECADFEWRGPCKENGGTENA